MSLTWPSTGDNKVKHYDISVETKGVEVVRVREKISLNLELFNYDSNTEKFTYVLDAD